DERLRPRRLRRERPREQRGDRCRLVRELRSELAYALADERREAQREGEERVVAELAGGKPQPRPLLRPGLDRRQEPAPEGGDRTGAQAWQEPGGDAGRLPRSARADDGDDPRRREPGDELVRLAAAAEEDRRVGGGERAQAGERRALPERRDSLGGDRCG